MFTRYQAAFSPTIWETDWVLNLRSALARCDSVHAYQNQMTICRTQMGGRLSFVHGVPGASGLASVNFAQDKRKRRALMERAGIPIPKGATFTFGRGRALSNRYVNRIGFPVALKPTLGDNGVDTTLNITSQEEFNAALDQLTVPPQERTHHTHSAYRMMLLDEPKWEEEQLVVPPKYSFLVEEHIEGSLFRYVVSDDRIISVIECNGSPSDGTYQGGYDAWNRVPSHLSDLALRASRAIPGILGCVLDIAVRKPASRWSKGKPVVVDFHERPGLWVQAQVDTALAARTADTIFDDYARAEGVKIKNRRESAASFSFEAHSLANAEANSLRIAQLADAFGLSLSDVRPNTSGDLYGHLSGELLDIAAMINSAFVAAGDAPQFPEIIIKRWG